MLLELEFLISYWKVMLLIGVVLCVVALIKIFIQWIRVY